MGEDRWLLSRLHTSELQSIISGLDIGLHGVLSISDVTGHVLARSPDNDGLTGQQFKLQRRDLVGSDSVLPLGVENSPIDKVERITTLTTLSEYPLAVYAGLGRQDVLAPWWPYVQASIGLYLLYWGAFALVYTSLRRATRRQDAMSEELRTGHAELRMAHQVGKICTWTVDEDASVLRWSPLARDVFGIHLDSLPVADFFNRVHHEDVQRLQAAFDDAFAGNGVLDEMFRIVLPGGTTHWVSARGQQVGGSDRERRMIGALTDVSERVQALARAQQAERQFRLLFDRNPAPFWVFDPDTLRFLEVNEAAVRQYGYSRDEFLAMSILDIRPREGWEEIRGAIANAASGDLQDAKVRLHRRKDGTVFEVRAHLARLDFDGREACLVLAEDISDRMAYERDLAYHATHNPATGLLNTRALAAQLDEEGGSYTIAYVQFRGLQLVADTLGREVGDVVLQAMAKRLGGLGVRYGLLAFQPAEDFIFAIRDDHERQTALDTLVQTVSEPVRGQDWLHQFEPRIGVAVKFDGDVVSAEQVIGMAAQAAHAARDEGSVIAWFDSAVSSRLADRLRLAGRIHSAIDAEFALYFQPICHASDGSPAALEALLRWPQADGSFIPPGEFIQLCEDTGLILALGRWVIREAARAQRQLVDAGWDLPIAVNVSAVQFFNSDLVAEFSRASQEFGLARGALHVELTESSLMRKPGQAKQTMQRMHEQGICISLDDFGTGYSNMSYLQHLPLDILKIDRSFVADVETNPRNASICRALLSLGHSMGLTVIAEGVETPGQHEWLAAHGCDQVQGFLLGRPAPLVDVIAKLETAAA
jgi:PAS domain S-box-containing protein